jgi:hypothetical protein
MFHARGSKVQNSAYGKPPYSGFDTTMSGWQSCARNDCIVHHCRTCQYEWTSRPLVKAKAKRNTVGKKGDV